MIKNVAIFASGEGTNAQTIIDYFRNSSRVKVALVVSNRASANVLNRARENGIPTLIIERTGFYESDRVIQELKNQGIDFIVLAGFLWMIPESLVKAFPNKIVNIHPALLPKFGGKGMFGMHVHNAVIQAKEKVSGISIHFVNEKYDEGKLIRQFACEVAKDETPESLAQKIQQLEHAHFPKVIEQLVG